MRRIRGIGRETSREWKNKGTRYKWVLQNMWGKLGVEQKKWAMEPGWVMVYTTESRVISTDYIDSHQQKLDPEGFREDRAMDRSVVYCSTCGYINMNQGTTLKPFQTTSFGKWFLQHCRFSNPSLHLGLSNTLMCSHSTIDLKLNRWNNWVIEIITTFGRPLHILDSPDFGSTAVSKTH